MTTITEIFEVYGPEYLEQHPHLPEVQRKAVEAIINCRSGSYGYVLYQCRSCGEIHAIGRSCGNRHCPQCQHHKTEQWLDNQLDRQLPGPHFLITFTVPEQLRGFIYSHQKISYDALFRASSEALRVLARDERFIGTDLPGFTGILHTWGRQMQFHPHIHYLVPGGGLSEDRSAWLPSRADFYLPVKALSPIYRAKFKEEMKKAGLLDQIPSRVWQTDWNVNSQAVGDGTSSLKYLAPYVFKVAISNSRIVGVKDRTVIFKYRKHGSSRYRTTALDVMEFIRRFLQHVLPSGFMKVRHYGFLNSSCPVEVESTRQMILVQFGGKPLRPARKTRPFAGPHCPDCGGPAFIRGFLPARSQFRDTG